MKKITSEFINYRELIMEFVLRDIKLKYRNSTLGVIWSMLNPLLVMIVLTFIFSNLFRNSIPNFPIYCLAGRLIYSAFSQSTNQGMKSIIRKSGLVKKIYIPLYIYPVASVLSSYVVFLISLLPLIFMMIVMNIGFSKLNILAIYPLIMLLITCLGTTLILTTLNIFFRDIEHLYSVVLLIIMYMSAIFYSIDIINSKYIFILKFNPIYSIISVFRDCILYGTMTSKADWIICGIYPIILLLVGYIIFNKYKDEFIHYI